jgi:hypothetical protein
MPEEPCRIITTMLPRPDGGGLHAVQTGLSLELAHLEIVTAQPASRPPFSIPYSLSAGPQKLESSDDVEGARTTGDLGAGRGVGGSRFLDRGQKVGLAERLRNLA